jgi:hypothetical protein
MLTQSCYEYCSCGFGVQIDVHCTEYMSMCRMTSRANDSVSYIHPKLVNQDSALRMSLDKAPSPSLHVS